jgi:TIR domain
MAEEQLGHRSSNEAPSTGAGQSDPESIREPSPGTQKCPPFLSYAREDSKFALRLAKDLRTAGTTVWLDQLDIKPGQRWDRSVEDALANCPILVIILSPASVASTNVMDEVSFALEQGKVVIPVLYRDCAIPFRLRRVQYLDFRVNYNSGLRDLFRTINIGSSQQTIINDVSPSSGEPNRGEPNVERQPKPHISARSPNGDTVPTTSAVHAWRPFV